MKLSFKPAQLKTLADFCNDVAKGLILAAIIGQGVLGEAPGGVRVAASLFWVLMSLFLLLLALAFSQEIEG